MKQLLFLVSFLVYFIFNSNAQDKSCIVFSFGPSIPLGNYSKEDINLKEAGFADIGAFFELSASHKFTKNIGASIIIRRQTNIIDNDALATGFEENVGGNWAVSSNSWGGSLLMAGGYGSFPIGENIFLDMKVLGGYIFATSPEFSYISDDSSGTEWYKQSSESATAFSFLLGVGLKFNLGEKFCLITNLDYLQANPEFQNVEFTSSSGATPNKFSLTQKIETLNFGIGFGFRF